MTTPRPAMWTTAPLDLADSKTLPDGRVETEVDFLELAPQHQAGGAGAFDPREFADEILSIHADEKSRGYLPPGVIGHPKKPGPNGTMVPDEGAPAVLWVDDVRRDGTRLKARITLNADFAARVRNREFLHVSPELRPYFDPKTGEFRGTKLWRIGVTNVPHQKGADGLPVGMLSLSEIVERDETDATPAPLPGKSGQEIDMTNDEIKALIAEETKGLRADLSDATTKITATEAAIKDATALLSDATTKIAALEARKPADLSDVTTKDATIADQEQRLAGLERAVKANQIKHVVELAESAGVLTPALKAKYLPGYDADPVAALDKSTLFNGKLLSLQEWASTTAPAVKVNASRQSAHGSQNGNSADLSDPTHPDNVALAKATGLTPEALAASAKRQGLTAV